MTMTEPFGRMGASDGQHHVRAVAGSNHRHAIGQPLQHMVGGHTRGQHAHHLTFAQRNITAYHRPVHSLR